MLAAVVPPPPREFIARLRPTLRRVAPPAQWSKDHHLPACSRVSKSRQDRRHPVMNVGHQLVRVRGDDGKRTDPLARCGLFPILPYVGNAGECDFQEQELALKVGDIWQASDT